MSSKLVTLLSATEPPRLVQGSGPQATLGQPGGLIKSVPNKGLYRQMMPFQEYVALMKGEARSEYRQYLRTHRRLTQGRLWA